MRRAALALAVLLAAAVPAAAATLVDDLGREVRVEAPARRIVTLAPSITEAVFAVGAGPRVVGVSAWSDWPPEAAGLPVVSSAAGLDLEALARLAPDLVIAWTDSFRPADIPRLEALGARVFVVRSRSLEQIPRLLDLVARLAGGDAGPATREFAGRLADLRARYAGRPAVRVFLEISHRPLMTVAGGHFMDEALAACGAVNVFADLPGAAAEVSWEALFARDPDAVIGTGPEGGQGEFLARWSRRDGLPAVRRGALAWVSSRALGRPSPRVVEGIEALCRAVDRVRGKRRP